MLDAKASAERALADAAARGGFEHAIVRPGQLFGGPYDNNFYLGTLFQLDKDAGTPRRALSRGDDAQGDTLRSALAEVLVQTLTAPTAPPTDFTVLTEKGEPPSSEDLQRQLARSRGTPDTSELLVVRSRHVEIGNGTSRASARAPYLSGLALVRRGPARGRRAPSPGRALGYPWEHKSDEQVAARLVSSLLKTRGSSETGYIAMVPGCGSAWTAPASGIGCEGRLGDHRRADETPRPSEPEHLRARARARFVLIARVAEGAPSSRDARAHA